MAEGFAIVSAAIPRSVRDSVEEVLKRERITMSEYLRLCLAKLSDDGRAPFEIPEASRGRRRHDIVGRSFFDV
ncbi:hypothetical protein B0G57_1445 [Trinickia symbiotica]|uniref:Uncharacterized protein n=1 Tax=Trinickia symbiotica TaxID=863227 RepID=A0A2N7WJP7_9BURK|nr:hypothetical protein C0Z20_30690 [Trinickia symbiotica]PPK41040.1 hypothetical protein B0G57_1445 [Trinickia symbiotica]